MGATVLCLGLRPHTARTVVACSAQSGAHRQNTPHSRGSQAEFDPKLLCVQKPLDVLVRKPQIAERNDIIDIECLFAIEAAPEMGSRKGIQPLVEVSEADATHGGVRRLR